MKHIFVTCALVLLIARFSIAQTSSSCGVSSTSVNAISTKARGILPSSTNANGPVKVLVIFAKFSNDQYVPYGNPDSWPLAKKVGGQDVTGDYLPTWADKLVETPLSKGAGDAFSAGGVTTVTLSQGSFSADDADASKRIVVINGKFNAIASRLSSTQATLANAIPDGVIRFESYHTVPLAGNLTDFYDAMSLGSHFVVGEICPEVVVATNIPYSSLKTANRDIVNRANTILQNHNMPWADFDNWTTTGNFYDETGTSNTLGSDGTVDAVIIVWRHCDKSMYSNDGEAYSLYSGAVDAPWDNSGLNHSVSLASKNGVFVVHGADRWAPLTSDIPIPDFDHFAIEHEYGHLLFGAAFEGAYHSNEDMYASASYPYGWPAQSGWPAQGGFQGLMHQGVHTQLSMWERTLMGWVNPQTAMLGQGGTEQTFVLKEAHDRTAAANEVALRIPIPGSIDGGYYLVENHQGTSVLDKIAKSATTNENRWNPDNPISVSGIWVQRANGNYAVKNYPADGFWDWEAENYYQFNCWGNYYGSTINGVTRPYWLTFRRGHSNASSGTSDFDISSVNYHPPAGVSVTTSHAPRDYTMDRDDRISGPDPVTGLPRCGLHTEGDATDPFTAARFNVFNDFTNPQVTAADDGTAVGFQVQSGLGASGEVTLKIIKADNKTYLPRVSNVHTSQGSTDCSVTISWDGVSAGMLSGGTSVAYSVHRKIGNSESDFTVPSGLQYEDDISNVQFPNGLSMISYEVVAIVGSITSSPSDAATIGVLKGSLSSSAQPYVFDRAQLYILGSPTIEGGATLVIQIAPNKIIFCDAGAELNIAGLLKIDNGDVWRQSLCKGGTLHVKSTGILSLQNRSSMELDCRVLVDVGGTWSIEGSAYVGLHPDRYSGGIRYRVAGSLAITGDASYATLMAISPIEDMHSDAAFPRIWTDISSVVNVTHAAFQSVQLKGNGIGSIQSCRFYAPANDSYSAIDWWEPNFQMLIKDNTFEGTLLDGQPVGEGIAIDDAPNGHIKCTNNHITGFRNGIVFWNAGGLAKSNHIFDCAIGIVAYGPVVPPRNFLLSSNTISTNSHSKLGDGIENWSANPYIFGNDISYTSNGVWMSASSPNMACNRIYSNTEGIYVQGKSSPDLTFSFGENHIFENDNAQIDCDGGTPLLNLGSNEIRDDRGPAPRPINLLRGVPGAQITAIDNYWGSAGTGGACTPAANCTAGPRMRSTFCFTWCPDDPTAAAMCLRQESIVCEQWPLPPTEELSVDPCDYWIAKLNHDEACALCDDAIDDAKQAIISCQSGTPDGHDPDGDLIALLQRLLQNTTDCHARNPEALLGIAHYFENASHSMESGTVRRAAKFMQAEAIGVAQYFDHAKLIFDSLFASATDPFDKKVDSLFSARMLHFKDVEGGNTGLLGKQTFAYKGRADMQPIGIDALELSASPNPFANQQVDVKYSLPVDDASDITLVKVVDVVGHDVTTLVRDVQAAGPHLVSFSGRDLPAGQFIVAVMTHNHVSSRLLIRLK